MRKKILIQFRNVLKEVYAKNNKRRCARSAPFLRVVSFPSNW